MYDWSLRLAQTVRQTTQFQLLLKGCTIEAHSATWWCHARPQFQLLLKGCTIEARNTFARCFLLKVSVVVERMYDWSLVRQFDFDVHKMVSVVVERMYDWSRLGNAGSVPSSSFSCCWKDVRLKRNLQALNSIVVVGFSCCWKDVRLKRNVRFFFVQRNWVSVVVERMYDWSGMYGSSLFSVTEFQLLLKGCTIEATEEPSISTVKDRFSCCWKDVRLKHIVQPGDKRSVEAFQLLLKGCTIEAIFAILLMLSVLRFSCCWKDVRLKPRHRPRHLQG